MNKTEKEKLLILTGYAGGIGAATWSILITKYLGFDNNPAKILLGIITTILYFGLTKMVRKK